MRLGAPVPRTSDPQQWIVTLREKGYSAAYCPLDETADDATVAAFARAAADADIVVAEVPAFGNNPISPDDAICRAALEKCQQKLALADRLGARCCVNVAGSRQPVRGPHAENFAPATFDLIVESVRQIVDAVRPTSTFYTLETMPWIFPDSADSYLALLRAIDRPRFAVHLDPVNLVCSPQRYYHNADLLRECFAKLGPYVKSCHGKDTVLENRLTAHLSEARPGTGGLDYRVFLTELDQLDPDTPLMLEHLPSQEEYSLAAEHVRAVARQAGVDIV